VDELYNSFKSLSHERLVNIKQKIIPQIETTFGIAHSYLDEYLEDTLELLIKMGGSG
jgi:hypothetical protein